MKMCVVKAALSLLFLVIVKQTIAQSYIPRVSPSITCSSGQFVTFGNNDVNQLSNRGPSATSAANNIFARQFNVTSSGIEINQLSLGILDNVNIQSMVRLRLGLFQLVGSTMVMLSETDEILLYPTSSLVIYGNLLQPVTLNIDTYFIGAWFSTTLITGFDTGISGFHNRASWSYSLYTFPPAVPVGVNSGPIALQAHGCAQEDPFTSPNTQIYKFCAYVQSSTPALFATSTSASQTVTHSFTGTIAVSTIVTGTDVQGEWRQITAGYTELFIVTGSPLSTSVAQTQFQRSLMLGGSSGTAFQQRFYPSAVGKVGDPGISFVSSIPGRRDQFILSHRNGAYRVDNMSPGSVSSYDAVVSGFDATPVSHIDAAGPVCNLPETAPIPDSFNCPSSSAAMIKFGDDDVNNAEEMDGTASLFLPANVMFFRVFTALSPHIQLEQLSMIVDANPSRIIKVRLGLFTNVRTSYQLLEQTREITLINTPATVLKVNLLNPVRLQHGQNYSIAVISDQAILTPAATFMSAPTHVSLTYADVMKSGFPSSVVTSTTGEVPFIGAVGCVSQQSAVTFSFCSSFVYDTYSTVYSGDLTTLSNPLDDIELGQYRLIITGSGTATRVSANGTSSSSTFTIRAFNLPSNNRLYLSGTPIDQFGFQFVVNGNPFYAVQLYSFYDSNSGIREFRENQQTATSSSVTFMRNIVSSLVYQPHSAGTPIPQCQALPRPANIVVPATVPRVVCSNMENSIIDSFGDSSVASFAQKSDGNTIAAHKVYSYPFIPANTAVVRQLAIGLLNNQDRAAEIQVRLGLYSALNHSLLVQTAELRLTEAIDQVVVVNLPHTVTVFADQEYYIAILTSSPLEVATTDVQVQSGPVMSTTYSSAGLPAVFAQTGIDVVPSISAVACVPSTHSFCSYFQYYTDAGSSTTFMYQGLLQASTNATADSYGTSLAIMAIGGRLTTYSRGDFATQTSTVYPFWQRPDVIGKLYTTSSNSIALGPVGLQLELEGGFQSTLLFNESINKLDESFTGLPNPERSLIYSGFSFAPLSTDGNIPSCGLSDVPFSVPAPVDPPTCPSGEVLIGYGDADVDDLLNSNNLQIAVRNTMFLRPFLTHATRGSLLSQLSVGINNNWNTINRIRVGVYSFDFKLLAVADDIHMVNPHDQIFTAVLKTPLYLAPNTRYFLAFHTEKTIYTGFTNVIVPSAVVDFEDGWANTFVQSSSNSQRAIVGWACSTDMRPIAGKDEFSGKNKNLSDGAVAGLVIGLVIGTNLLLLVGMYMCCFRGGVVRGKQTQVEHRNIVESSQVEMNHV